jgi:hypothetical protein
VRGRVEPARKVTRMGVTALHAAADPETMRILAAVLLLCVCAPVASAGRPVAILAADIVVDRHAHMARASTIVVDDASQVLDRRYRTTLRYRCADRWLTARRIARGPASATITWRYPARLAGKRCSFRIIVERIGQPHQARSAILRRAL